MQVVNDFFLQWMQCAPVKRKNNLFYKTVKGSQVHGMDFGSWVNWRGFCDLCKTNQQCQTSVFQTADYCMVVEAEIKADYLNFRIKHGQVGLHNVNSTTKKMLIWVSIYIVCSFVHTSMESEVCRLNNYTSTTFLYSQ